MVKKRIICSFIVFLLVTMMVACEKKETGNKTTDKKDVVLEVTTKATTDRNKNEEVSTKQNKDEASENAGTSNNEMEETKSDETVSKEEAEQSTTNSKPQGGGDSGNTSDKPSADVPNVQTETSKLIKNILSNIIRQDMSELEKVLVIHDYITYNVDYDYENYLNNTIPAASYTSQGALSTGRAVCSGYAYLFFEMAKGAGLDVICVEGTADNGSGNGQQAHAWNQVKVNNQWYNIDTCWDDPTTVGKKSDDHSMNTYEYCLISDNDMYKDHQAFGDYVHKCSKNYDTAAFAQALAKVNKYCDMVYVESVDKLNDVIKKLAAEGKNTYSLLLVGDGNVFWENIYTALSRTKKPLWVESSSTRKGIGIYNIAVKENVYCIDANTNLKSIIDTYNGKLDKLELWFYDDAMTENNASLLVNRVLYKTGYNVEVVSRTDITAGKIQCHIKKLDNVLNVNDLSEAVTYTKNNGIDAIKSRYIWYKTNNTDMTTFADRLREAFISSGYLVDYDWNYSDTEGYTDVIKFKITDVRTVKYIGSVQELVGYVESIGLSNIVGKEIYIKNSQHKDSFNLAYNMFYQAQYPVEIGTLSDWGSVVGVEVDAIQDNVYISVDEADLKADIIDAKNKGIVDSVEFRLLDIEQRYNRDLISQMIDNMGCGVRLGSCWDSVGNCHVINLWRN